MDLPKPSFHSHLLRVGRPALRFGGGCAALCLSWFSTSVFGFSFISLLNRLAAALPLTTN
jgi:hypothetical protein